MACFVVGASTVDFIRTQSWFLGPHNLHRRWD